MGHVQKRCDAPGCRRVLPSSARMCAYCDGRGFAFVARWVDPDRRERSKSFARRIDADAFLTSTESAKARGGYVDPSLGKETVEQQLTSWMLMQRPRLKPKTTAGTRA